MTKLQSADQKMHPSRRRSTLNKLMAVAIFLLSNSFYYFLLFGSVPVIAWCCDANSYISQSTLVLKEGVLAHFDWVGYRSYFNYAFVALIRAIGASAGFEITPAAPTSQVNTYAFDWSYSAGAIIWFGIMGISVIARFGGKRCFWTVFIPLFCNPLLFAYVPYPLQEGQVALVFVPLAAWVLLSYSNAATYSLIVTASLLVGTGWMIKSSYILVVIPVLIFIGVFLWREVTGWRLRLGLSFLSLTLMTLPIAPQIASSLEYFGSLRPYPNQAVLEQQFAWGWEMWRYDTFFDQAEGRFRGKRFPSPFAAGDPAAFNLQARIQQEPGAAAALALGHIFGSFNQANPLVYATNYTSPSFSLPNLIVGTVIFLGLAAMALAWIPLRFRPENIFIDGMILGNAAVLPFVAVESRFSLISLIFLSLRATALIHQRLSGREWILIGIGSLLFSASFVLIGTLMFQIAALQSPSR